MQAKDYGLDATRRRALLQRLEAELPVDDLLGWLIGAFPTAGRDEVFAMLKAVYEADLDIAPAASQAKAYRVGGQAVKAFPQRVRTA